MQSNQKLIQVSGFYSYFCKAVYNMQTWRVFVEPVTYAIFSIIEEGIDATFHLNSETITNLESTYVASME